jgi:hypothetical protein
MVKDIEFKFWTIRIYPRYRLKSSTFRLAGQFPRVELIKFFCVRFVHAAQAGKRGLPVERVNKRSAEVRDEHHIAGIYMFEATLEPSNPTPSVITFSVNSLAASVRWCR